MRINTNITYEMTKEDIEKAIKEYIDRRIDEALDTSRTKVQFKVQDVGVDDDDRMPYCASYQLVGATVTPSYLM